MTVRRVLWVAVGAVAGVTAVRVISRKVAKVSPEALGGVLGRAAETWQDLTATVRESMAEREIELRSALGIRDGEAGPESAAEEPGTTPYEF